MRISDWSSDVCSSDLPLGKIIQRDRLGRKLTNGDRGAAPAEWRHDHIDAAAILQTGVGQWCGLIDAAAHLVDDALGDRDKMSPIAKLARRALRLAFLFIAGLFGDVSHDIFYNNQ